MQVMINDIAVDLDHAIHLMDDDIREQLHATITDNNQMSEQEFIDRYCELHAEKFGKEFMV